VMNTFMGRDLTCREQPLILVRGPRQVKLQADRRTTRSYETNKGCGLRDLQIDRIVRGR